MCIPKKVLKFLFKNTQKNGRSKSKPDIQLFGGNYWVRILQEAQWREMGGNQDVLEHVSYYMVLFIFWAHLIQKLFVKYFTDGCALFQNANCLDRWPHIWVRRQHKTEKSSCIFKQLLSVADLKWVMTTKDFYINKICEWYLFLYFWQSTKFCCKHFRMFDCLICMIAMETYCLIECTGVGEPKPG